LQRLKELTTVHDLTAEELEAMGKIRDLPDYMREEIAEKALEAFKRDGNRRLLRAFTDGTMTEKEYLDWKSKGIGEIEFSTILGAYYAKKDGFVKKGEAIHIVAMPDAPLMGDHKESIEKRFGIHIMSIEEANEEMQKGDKLVRNRKDV